MRSGMSITKRASKYKMRVLLGRVVKDIGQGKKPDLASDLKELGYSEKSAKSLAPLKRDTWKGLLDKINDKILLDRLNQLALDDKDKRISLEAIREILKLKDRYPKSKLAFEMFEQEVAKIEQ